MKFSSFHIRTLLAAIAFVGSNISTCAAQEQQVTCSSSSSSATTTPDEIILESFADPSYDWDVRNDPVMGGQSYSSMELMMNEAEEGGGTVAYFAGEVKDVPYLGLPGFIKTQSTGRKPYPDVSCCESLKLTVRGGMEDYAGYRVSFGTKRATTSFFASGFKANFDAPMGEYGEVLIPFEMFSVEWDGATGDQTITCAEDPAVCPDRNTLQDMQTIALWGEGVGGSLNLYVKAISAVGCADSSSVSTTTGDVPNRSEKDIPAVAMENGSFTTLVAALSATDLVGAISEPNGPFTVFAPTDDAFEALPNGLVECLLQDDNLTILSDILLYHVASGEAFSTDLRNGMRIPTLQGEEVTVDLNNNNGVKINDSTVVGADVLASNGVIHVLNQVLVPPTVDVGAFLQTCSNTGAELVDIPTTAYDWDDQNDASLVDIPTTAINAGIFSTLVAALSATNLVGAISEPAGPLTVFAPNDAAFTALPDGLVSCLLEEQNLPILSDILLYHVAAGTALSTDLSNGQQIATLLEGAKVTVDLTNNGVKINGSNVVGADVLASNGVIHIIDAVLVPARIDVGAFLQTCPGNGNGTGSSPTVPPPSQNNNDEASEAAADDVQRSDQDIPGVASENGSFTTLVAALSATDLAGALSEPDGPFTVFAPTDDAFEALPTGLVECLLQEQNVPVLSNILLYHVAAGETMSTELSPGMEIPTLLAQQAVTVELRNNNGVQINDATVVGADVLASNGVIHVINQVLVPPSVDVDAFLQTCDTVASSASASAASSLPDIPTTAINAGVFTTLVAALSATDIVGALSAPNGPYTVFAPTDDAFTTLPNGLVSCLLEEQNLPILSDILFYHVASGQALSTELSNRQQLSTLLEGAKVTVDLNNNNGGVKINGSNVITANVLASNGVIHSIDQVLVPPRIDVGAFLQTCVGSSSSSSSGGDQSVQSPPGHNNNDTCTYLGVQRSAGQYLVGPTHTCLCTYGGVWTQCRLN